MNMSEPDGSSRLNTDLPGNGPGHAPLFATTGSSPAGPTPGPVDRPRILLAEDNAVNQKVAALMLNRFGYRVDFASDGVEAVAAAKERRYALVLMDFQMPNMDGLEATRQIRLLERAGAHIPIVALTAGGDKESRDQCLGAGMDDYLAKPLRAEALRSTLDRWAPFPHPLRLAESPVQHANPGSPPSPNQPLTHEGRSLRGAPDGGLQTG
jgi:CheY-like chemotaxis protein